MSRFLKTLTLACTFTVLASSVTFADKVDEDYNFAYELFTRKKWESASEQFKTIIDDYPTSLKATQSKFFYGFTLIELAHAMPDGAERTRFFSDARKQLREFVKDSPKNKLLPDAEYRVGECSFHMGDFKSAEIDLSGFIKAHSTHKLAGWALSYLGDSQLALKKYPEATTSFQRILSDFQQEKQVVEDAHWGLGRIFEQTKSYEESLKMYRVVANGDPGNSLTEKAEFKVGMIHLERKKPEEAVAVFEQFSTKFPNSRLNSLAWLNAGLSRYRLKQYRPAFDNFQKVDSKSRYGAQAIRYSALSSVRMKKLDDAIEILKGGITTYGKDKSAESISYTLADTYRLAKKYPEAQTQFLTVANSWPNGTYAVKAFHLAAECALLGGDPEKCAELVDTFDATYKDASTTLKTRSAILRGRMLLTVGEIQNQQKAVEILNSATSRNADPATTNLARKYLVRGQRSLGQHRQAFASAQPLVEDVLAGKADDFWDIVLLAASSALQADKRDDAIRLSGEYLKHDPESNEARAIRTRAEAGEGNIARAMQDLDSLKGDPDLYHSTALQLGNTAYDTGEYLTASKLFGIVASAPKTSDDRARGLSGLGWSLFKLKKYDASAAEFGTLATDHPINELAPEAYLMQGQSLKLANKKTAAIDVLQKVFDKYAPATAESQAGKPKPNSPRYHAFRAGLSAARLIGPNNIDAADTLWSQIADRFSGSTDLDSVLEEWAFLNLEAQRYARSDEIFARLVAETPNSPRVPRAKLALTESALVNKKLDEAETGFQELAKNKQAPEDVQEAAMFQLIRIAQDKGLWQKVDDRSRTLMQRFPDSDYQDEATLRLGEALFNLHNLDGAVEILQPLRTSLLQNPAVPGQDPDDTLWSGRLWVVLAEVQLIAKNYDVCRATIAELVRRDPNSPFMHQAYELLGRSYIRQAPSRFDKAREYFDKAIVAGPGSRTAAKAQFMIGETWLLDKDFKQAKNAYLRTSIKYRLFPEWQAPALYQAAQCEESLGLTQNATDSYEELIRDHSKSEFARKAKMRLKFIRDNALQNSP